MKSGIGHAGPGGANRESSSVIMRLVGSDLMFPPPAGRVVQNTWLFATRLRPHQRSPTPRHLPHCGEAL
jgi:hypothetical protein